MRKKRGLQLCGALVFVFALSCTGREGKLLSEYSPQSLSDEQSVQQQSALDSESSSLWESSLSAEETASILESSSSEETSSASGTSSSEETSSASETSSLEETSSASETSSSEETSSTSETSSLEETSSTSETSSSDELPSASEEESSSSDSTSSEEPPAKEKTLKFILSDDGSFYCVAGLGEVTDREITVPASYQGKAVKEIQTAAFAGGNFTKITLSEGIERIENSAFAGCAQLTCVELPASLQSVGAMAFCGCGSLEEAQFANTEGWSAGGLSLPLGVWSPQEAAKFLRGEAYYEKKNLMSVVWERG